MSLSHAAEGLLLGGAAGHPAHSSPKINSPAATGILQSLPFPRCPAILAAWQRAYTALSKHVASPLPKLGAPHHTKPLIPLHWLFAAGGSGAMARDRGCFRLGWLEAHGEGCQELEECTNPRVQSGHPQTHAWALGSLHRHLWVWLRNRPPSHSWGPARELGGRQGCAAGPAFGNAGTAFAQLPRQGGGEGTLQITGSLSS